MSISRSAQCETQQQCAQKIGFGATVANDHRNESLSGGNV
jgi:hypothetical protein